MQEMLKIPALDGYPLAATLYEPEAHSRAVVVINSATAVPRHFYGPFAEFLASQGYTAITYDYRGIGGSRPASLRGFTARASDWALRDMAGVVDWVRTGIQPDHLALFGHSYGGQTAGLLPNGHQIDAMVTVSSQSGYWRLQGGKQKFVVGFHVHVSFPVLCRVFGYFPWSWFSAAEDLPKRVALDWAGWCRRPGYLLDDPTLPLERFRDFTAPVLALSLDDDDWGTSRAVDAMMQAYPNVTRHHVIPAEAGIDAIGHFGFFRPKSEALWHEVADWLSHTLDNSAS